MAVHILPVAVSSWTEHTVDGGVGLLLVTVKHDLNPVRLILALLANAVGAVVGRRTTLQYCMLSAT
eukprot:839876-Amphidinium_carterae.2